MIPEPQRTYLLELLDALGPAAEGLILVGGQALRFMIEKARPTRDFDFVLNVALFRETNVSLESILTSLGYSVVEKARNFQFEKQIPGSKEVMRIEFMAPSESVRRDGIRVEIQKGIHGRACEGGSIVVVETDGKEIMGSLPDGRATTARVQVTRPHALVLLKLLAVDERYRNVRGPEHLEHDRQEARTHAEDIVAVMTALTNHEEFRKRFASQFARDAVLKERIYQIIASYFGDVSRPGLILYGESLMANSPSGEVVGEIMSELRRAQRLVAGVLL